MRLRIFLAVLLLLGCTPSEDKLSKLTIETQDKTIEYEVETAATRKQMEIGLMNRQQLAENSGMIFVLNGEHQVVMWMKDTHIPLDMLFADQNGEIVYIYENAEPESVNLIYPKSCVPLYAVLELNGGDVQKHGIKVGDKIKHKTLPRQ